MKTVMIPSNVTPNFVCEINGKVYSYPAGTEQSVPDEVAALIGNINAMIPQEAAAPGKPGQFWLRLKDGAWWSDTRIPVWHNPSPNSVFHASTITLPDPGDMADAIKGIEVLYSATNVSEQGIPLRVYKDHVNGLVEYTFFYNGSVYSCNRHTKLMDGWKVSIAECKQNSGIANDKLIPLSIYYIF